MKYRLMFTFSGDQQKKQNAGEDQPPGVQDPDGDAVYSASGEKAPDIHPRCFGHIYDGRCTEGLQEKPQKAKKWRKTDRKR